jgi:hypothetical protein
LTLLRIRAYAYAAARGSVAYQRLRELFDDRHDIATSARNCASWVGLWAPLCRSLTADGSFSVLVEVFLPPTGAGRQLMRRRPRQPNVGGDRGERSDVQD